MKRQKSKPVFKQPVAMSAGESDTFDLIKSLDKNEINLLRRRISFYEKIEESAIQLQLFNTMLGMQAYNEAELKKKFKSLSKLKTILWEKILAILQSAETTEPELIANRKLDFIHLLIGKNLKKQAFREVQKVKQFCKEYDLLHHEAIALTYEGLTANYMAGLDFIGLVKRSIEELGHNSSDLKQWGDARIYYLNLLLSENTESVRSQMFPIQYFVKHPLYNANISALPFPAAMDVANTVSKISYLQKDYDACYQIHDVIIERMKTKPVRPQSRWNWLRNRIALHEASERPASWKTDLREMEELFKKHFSNDRIREAVLIDATMRYTFLQAAKATGQAQKAAALKENEAALLKAKAFIEGYPAPINDTLVVFLFANVMKIYFDRNDHENFTNLHLLFDSHVPRALVPDIHAIFRIFLPIIHFEHHKLTDVQRTAKALRNFAKNDNKGDHQLDHLIATLMLKIEELFANDGLNKSQKQEKQIVLLKEFGSKVKGLKSSNHAHTLSVCIMFDLEKWAELKIKKLQ